MVKLGQIRKGNCIKGMGERLVEVIASCLHATDVQ